MKHLWTWSGTYFGYRDSDNLRTHGGKHVGRFHGDEVYGTDGGYLGEIKNGNRLITHISKKSRRRYSFAAYARTRGFAKYANYVGYVMYVGYEDFPEPEGF